MLYLIQLLNAVQYGLLLFLLSSRLTLIFGIIGVIDLAHGSFYMVGPLARLPACENDWQLWLLLPLIPISLSEAWNLITRISREQVTPFVNCGFRQAANDFKP